MSGNDLFSDESFGTFSSYSQRNQEAVRAERAQDADRRISEFASRQKTLEWAREALEFCKREREAGADIADISTGIQDLARIEAEAESIIEKDRLDRENQRRAQEERERLARERDVQAVLDRIAELDSMIGDLSAAPESSYWCDEVGRVKSQVDAAPQNIRLKLKNLPKLDKMLDRVRVLREAYDISKKIAELKKVRTKGEAWAKDILDLNLLVSFENAKDITDLDYIENSMDEANRILRASTVDAYKKCLEAVERGNAASQIEAYGKLNKSLGSLGYSPELYISDFDKRWRAAGTEVAATDKRIKEEAAERERIRIAEERAENERRRAAAAAKRKKEQQTLFVQNILRLIAPVAALLLTLVLAFLLGPAFGEIGFWAILAVGYAVTLNVARLTLPFTIAKINMILSIILALVAIVCFFIEGLSAIGFIIALAILLSTVGIIIQDRMTDGEYMMSAYVLVVSVALAFIGSGFIFNALFEDYDPMCYCLGLGSLCATLLALLLRHLSNYDDGEQFRGLGGAVLIIAGVAFIGGIFYSFGVGVNDLAGFLGLGLSIMGGCLAPILMDLS